VAALSACQFFEQILLQRLHAKALVLGYDNMFGSKHHNDFDRLPSLAKSLGVSVAVDTAVRFRDIDISSTQVRKALKMGDVELAADFLGYNYRLWGLVVKGRQMGRQLGFPTANVCLDDTTKVMPADGVYAVRVQLENSSEIRMGMANFGGQPTFGLDKPVFEVNIFDFDGDLYGTTLSVEFVSRLRDVQKFGSIPELVDQLCADRDDARRHLAENS
jgi:riboflavin kinase/FMN adenylyltransferase